MKISLVIIPSVLVLIYILSCITSSTAVLIEEKGKDISGKLFYIGTKDENGPLSFILNNKEVLNYNNKGDELSSEGNYDEALKYYDNALAIDPNDPYAQYKKALALVELGRYEEAVIYYDKYLATNPNVADAVYNKALALVELGRYEEGISNYDKFLIMRPNDSNAIYNKALALEKLGNYEEAMIYYDKYLVMDLKDTAQVNSTFKTYENPGFGLSLRYPPNWSVEELRNDPYAFSENSIVVIFKSPSRGDNDNYLENVIINVQGPRSDIKSLKTYTQNSIQAFNDMNHINIINSGKDTLGGFPAHQINYTSTAIPGLDLKKMQIFTVIDNMAYVVTFGAEQAEFYKNIQDVENLINSIKIENSLTHLASVDKPVEPLIPDKVNIEHANPLVALDFIFDNYLSFGIAAVIIIALIIFFGGLRMVRPTHRAAIERLSRYHRFMKSGITWIIPIIDRIYPVNITEQMADADQQEIITKDNLNAFVDVQIYFKVKEDEESVKAALYNVNDYRLQIISLARTTLRNVIGNKEFSQVNNNRTELNKEILGSIQQQTANWGLEIVRCELKEIQPPADVQQTMNTVLKAQNEKQAAIDFATARETAADGEKRAAIKQAEGQMQSAVLKAQGEAQAILKVAEARSKEIQIINEAAQKYFVGNAQILKQLEVNETAMKDNTKFVIAEKGTNPVIVFGQDGVPTNNVIVTKPKDKYPSDIS